MVNLVFSPAKDRDIKQNERDRKKYILFHIVLHSMTKFYVRHEGAENGTHLLQSKKTLNQQEVNV